MKKIIHAYSDIFVKYLLGSEGNEKILLSFINDVMNNAGYKKIKSVKIMNPFNLKTFPTDKESIVDVRAVDKNGKVYNIEIQSTYQKDFKNRVLFYWSEKYASQLKEGEKFTKLKPVISINIVNFNIIEECNDYHNWFYPVKNGNPEIVLSKHFLIHFLELKKIPKKNTEIKSHLEKWLFYLKNEGKEGIDMTYVIKDDETLEKAHDIYEHFTEDDELREAYWARTEWERRHLSDIENAKEEGKEEGEINKAKKMAKKMKKNNEPIDKIIDYTGLSIEEIEKL